MVRHVFVFFFFQAEDGIRDLIVTGVQTCALPISDKDLAARLGRTVIAIRNRRKILGIRAPEKPQWTNEEEALLGQIPDADAAQRLRRSGHAVKSRRVGLKIAPCAVPGTIGANVANAASES